MAGLIYIFFKYIAADDEEDSQGTGDGASPGAPAAASRNGSSQAPTQPPTEGRWSQPLKLVREAIPQLPDIGALVQQRSLFGRGATQSAESSGKEAEGTDRQQQGALTSRPDDGEQATQQVSFHICIISSKEDRLVSFLVGLQAAIMPHNY